MHAAELGGRDGEWVAGLGGKEAQLGLGIGDGTAAEDGRGRPGEQTDGITAGKARRTTQGAEGTDRTSGKQDCRDEDDDISYQHF